VEYRQQGHRDVSQWIDSSLERLKTASARRLAEAALEGGVLRWQRTRRREEDD
jgi:putative hydrolase of HD superfamily